MFGQQQINSIKNALKSADPSDSFTLQFKALRLLGTFPHSYNVFLMFPSMLIVLLWITSSIYLIAGDVALDDKLQGSFTANASLLCCVKMYYIRKEKRKLLKLVNNLKSRVNDMNEEETKTLCRSAIYPTVTCYLMLQVTAFVSCTIYSLFPVGKSNYERPLPVYGWCPHYFKDGIAYKCFYILQYMSIVFASSLWVCVDTINFGLLAHHNVMLKILGQRIAKLGWTEKFKGSNYHTDNYEQLCEYVKYHSQISSYDRDSNEIYNSVLFSKVTFSVIIICSFVYTLGMQTSDYGGFMAHLGILTVIVTTLFVLSWISEQISATSNNLLNKAAECDFQSMDRRTIKALLIFMQGLSPTVYIDVGSPLKITLNLKMFVTILDFAYKCLTLLKTTV